MSLYRQALPQLRSKLFLTDSGLETTLVFLEGIDLPCFAAFDLLRDEEGRDILRRYYKQHIDIARRNRSGFLLETPTWRANSDWGRQLGYSADDLADANRRAIDLMVELRANYQTDSTPLVVSGNLGPRGDGYRPEGLMTVEQARAYHAAQINTFADTDADMVAGFTLNYVEEAVGMTLAARDASIPVAISFTLETDGRLPTGDSLADAIKRTDEDTRGYPAYYMINCAHPTHFEHILQEAGTWRERIRGLRANSSRRSHAELDESTELDVGDPQELGSQYRELRGLLPNLTILGGCCGTDHRHVEAIGTACA